ncbi:MAG TPA: 2-hydroxyglutaryl-CoA dehydratase [Lachnospiraceae bacterium]|nr:2-hydroxyglutaryl-CoA dehydratase [Lachnospiraceae bacterium]
MYTLGIDVGSASSKCVILKDGKEIVVGEAIQVGTGSTGPKRVLEICLEKSGLQLEDMAEIVATGYGRFSLDFTKSQISEISCHAKGINFLVPTARTIIDIGGQDAKAISLDENGRVKQFFMNDKCAAGTGRFLDVMSKVLEVKLNEMQEYDSRSKHAASVSSTCTVFAESEVISQLSKGLSKEDIIAGVHQSVASKVSGLVYRASAIDDVVMCGGVAKNAGVVRAMERVLQKKITVAPTPQITGAIGAALFAYEQANK